MDADTGDFGALLSSAPFVLGASLGLVITPSGSPVVVAGAGLSGGSERTLGLAIEGGDRGVEDHSLLESVEPGILPHSCGC